MKFTIKKSTVKMMVKVIDKVSFGAMAFAGATILMYVFSSLFVDWNNLGKNLVECLAVIIISGIVQAILHPQS